MKLPFYWIDAFTQKPFGGNPCAVVTHADSLTSDQMQTIAKEFNLSETAFVTAIQNHRVQARYFTPAEEIPMAGHPTISTIYALVQNGLVSKDVKELTLTLPAGNFAISIGAENEIGMTQKAPEFLKTYDKKWVAEAFGLEPDDLISEFEPQTVSTGTPQLMIAVKSLEKLLKAELNIAKYLEIKSEGDFFSPHLFCTEGYNSAGQTFARHFGVPPDTFEDAFTGSATGGMAAYLWHHQLLESPQFIAQQGHAMGRPGQARVVRLGNSDEIQGIQIWGYAVQMMSGEMSV